MVASDARVAAFRLALARTSCAALGLAGAACAFDDRTLHETPLGAGGEGGEAGSPLTTSSSGANAGPASAGGSGTGGSFGAAGGSGGSEGASSTGSTGAPLPPSTNIDCPDLDRNSVADCEETLADNAGFEASTEGWQAQEPAELDWHAGSVAVVLTGESDKRSMEGAYQCLEVEAGSSYLVYAQTLLGEEQASAALSVLFHDTSDCSGERIDEATSHMLSASERWRVLHMQAGAPAGAQSMRVRLVAVKNPALESVEVRFDNVLVRRQ